MDHIQQLLDRRRGTADAVLGHLRPDVDIVVPIANGEPVTVLDALERTGRDGQLHDVRLHQMHALHDRDYLHGRVDGMRHISYFLSHITRPAFHAGTIDLIPNHFSEVPVLLDTARDVELVVASAAPPDEHGFFSLGTTGGYTSALIGRVPFFIEANARMPATRGRNRVHINDVIGWCEADYPLVEVPPPVPDEIANRIADHVAERVPNGATIQAGIGAVPEALLAKLAGHRDLSIHTELFADGLMGLATSGAVRLDRPAITTFALGTQALYDYIEDNPTVQFHRVDVVNSREEIAQHPSFVSINATVEVDLYGQCASETINGKYWSSSGGQADFARGALHSPGGKGFIVLPSTARRGSLSRIVGRLTAGSVVTTLKNTVDHVVTEHGVAELRGRSLRERAAQLIGIPDPAHRPELWRAAREMDLA